MENGESAGADKRSAAPPFGHISLLKPPFAAALAFARGTPLPRTHAHPITMTLWSLCQVRDRSRCDVNGAQPLSRFSHTTLSQTNGALRGTNLPPRLPAWLG